MQPVQLELGGRPHRNRQLFSDHYLDAILPARVDWRMREGEAARLMAALGAIYARYTPSANEAQTERDLVRPVLEALGHTFEVQSAIRTPGAPQRPDYIFYVDEAARTANRGVAALREADLGHTFAVGDAKYWDRPLDQALRGGGDPFSNRNPGYQISFYMQHTRLTWGILTNGRRWRLYHKDSAHQLDRYYEVDLVDLLERGDAAEFQYFSGFFGRAAFGEGTLSLAALLAASTDYARAVSEGLKEQVYDALRHVVQGFLDYPANGLAADEETLTEIHANGLILLYRLLFILYAEARGLLPVRTNEMYGRVYSLDAIKKDVARQLDLGQPVLPTSGVLWPRLRELFGLIDAGAPPLNVATFNGGLFDAARHPFLARYTVGDEHLRLAIDKLARVGGQLVDYRDLAERHLGTIYEGLLEYVVRPLPEPEGLWTVELVTHEGGRKATGNSVCSSRGSGCTARSRSPDGGDAGGREEHCGGLIET